MFKKIKFLFKSKPSEKFFDLLKQSRLLMSRINEDEDMKIPRVASLLKKSYKDFDDEVYSTFHSILLLSKKVAEYKHLNYELDPWFETQMNSAVEHTFLILDWVDTDSAEEMMEFIINFYSPNNTVSKNLGK